MVSGRENLGSTAVETAQPLTGAKARMGQAPRHGEAVAVGPGDPRRAPEMSPPQNPGRLNNREVTVGAPNSGWEQEKSCSKDLRPVKVQRGGRGSLGNEGT